MRGKRGHKKHGKRGGGGISRSTVTTPISVHTARVAGMRRFIEEHNIRTYADVQIAYGMEWFDECFGEIDDLIQRNREASLPASLRSRPTNAIIYSLVETVERLPRVIELD